jgi:adenosine deaminase
MVKKHQLVKLILPQNFLMKNLAQFVQALPKAELHLHIEGSFEPELMFEIAKRNNISIPFNSVEEVKAAYKFNNLQEFLDIYYAGANVLITEQDFFDLTWAYLIKVHSQNVKHVELFFDPQTHTERGVEFHTVLLGIYKALEQGEKELGISFRLIMSYLRHLSEESAFETFNQSLPFKDLIDGVGLDSSEVGNPPEKFEKVFQASAEEGYKLCAHAGEEGPAEYIWGALDILRVDRIDHGNRCLDDEKLVERLVKEQMPLTLCPLSNLELKVIQDLKDFPLKRMMELGLLVTLHSDDPAYFGGYMNENFIETAKAIDLSKEEIGTLMKNGFEASWLTTEEKEKWKVEIDAFAKEY